jgi:hypothetical protein
MIIRNSLWLNLKDLRRVKERQFDKKGMVAGSQC